MSKITSFFKPVAAKRSVDQVNGQPDQAKRRCPDIEEQIAAQVARTPALEANIGTSWFRALRQEFDKEYFKKLSDFIVKERATHTIYPPVNQVYTWTRACPIDQVKVVLLGQDPYHGRGQAHGLSFSVLRPQAQPPSLVNMFKELKDDVGAPIPKHGDLTGWAKQGVLLLNAALTVRENAANSHSGHGWEQFTDAVIKYVAEHNEVVVFLLWGVNAQKKASLIRKKKKHLVLTCVHPSPLSAHRGFSGCKHFSKTNEWLKKHGLATINWGNLP